MRFTLALVLTVSLPGALRGQQSGDVNRDYLINGGGAGAASYVPLNLGVPGAFVQDYQTQDPFAPVLWMTAPTGTPSWVLTATNSVDVGPAGLGFLVNGIDPANPLWLYSLTDGQGAFSLPLVAPGTLAGSSAYFAMAHVAATSPDGFWVSQTHVVSFTLDPALGGSNSACNPAGSPQVLSDDSFVQVNLTFPFQFYGQTYSSCFIGSNGYLTFGSGDSSLSESSFTLLGGAPRVAMWWDDLNPGSGGSVTFFTSGSFAEICFTQVPEFSSSGANTFKCSLLPTGPAIVLDYGVMSGQDGLVGCSPGGGLDPTGQPKNLSLGGNVITPGSAFYELFDFSNPNDLSGFQTTIVLDGMGRPVLQA